MNPHFAESWWGPRKLCGLVHRRAPTRIQDPPSPAGLHHWNDVKPPPFYLLFVIDSSWRLLLSLSLTQLSHNSFVTCHILGTPTNSSVPFVVRPIVAVILHIRKKVKLPSGRQRADHESKTTAHSPSFLLPSMSPGRCVRGAQGEGKAAPPQGCGPASPPPLQARPTDSMLGMKPKRACLPKNSHEKSSHESSQLCTNLILMKMFKNLFLASLTWWCKIQN